MVRPYLRGFRRDFHPWQTAVPSGFGSFVRAWTTRPDALAATAEAVATV